MIDIGMPVCASLGDTTLQIMMPAMNLQVAHPLVANREKVENVLLWLACYCHMNGVSLHEATAAAGEQFMKMLNSQPK